MQGNQNLNDMNTDDQIMVFTTSFANNFCVAPMVGFNPKKFIGTRKEYDLGMVKYYESEELGKVIGIDSKEWLDERTEDHKKMNDPNFNPFALLEDTPDNREIYGRWKGKPRQGKKINKYKDY